MKFVDRIIWALVAATTAAIVLPAVMPQLATLVVVVTICFVIVRVTYYFTNRW